MGIANLGFSLRLDSVSVVMLTMIAVLSLVIIRFSANYLEGDSKHGAFIGRLAATIASVQLFVLSGNLALLFIAWVFTSISLHRLLVFIRIARLLRWLRKRNSFWPGWVMFVCLWLSFFCTGNLEQAILK